MPYSPGSNTGHGHIWERPDGIKARCGGPRICKECARDYAQKMRALGQAITYAEVLKILEAVEPRDDVHGAAMAILRLLQIHGFDVVIPKPPEEPQP